MPPRTAGTGAGREVRVFSVIARLAPGVTPTQASAEGTSIARALGPRPIAADMLFGKGGSVVVTARTLVAELTKGVRPILLLLSVSVTLLLLLGCANVASLCLSRGLSRESEIAMRAAGAGRGRLARQLGTESLVLAGTSAVLGVFIAWALIHAWPLVAPRSFPRTGAVALTWGGVLYAAVLSLAAGLFVGIAPALQAFRVRALAVVRAGASLGRPSLRARQVLLVVQSAVAVVLLVGAVSLVRSFERIVSQDTGYDAAGVITARVSLEPGRQRAENWPRVAAELAERAGGLPFVDAVGVASMAPLGSSTLLVGFRMAGDRPEPEIARALGYIVTPATPTR